jgi:hypothetical protein
MAGARHCLAESKKNLSQDRECDPGSVACLTNTASRALGIHRHSSQSPPRRCSRSPPVKNARAPPWSANGTMTARFCLSAGAGPASARQGAARRANAQATETKRRMRQAHLGARRPTVLCLCSPKGCRGAMRGHAASIMRPCHAGVLPCLATRGDCRYTLPSFARAATFWARSSAVEHYLDMVGVTGSIPVAPTIRRPGNHRQMSLLDSLNQLRVMILFER